MIPFGVIVGLATGYRPARGRRADRHLRRRPRGRRVAAADPAQVPWGKPLDLKVLWTMSREAMAMVGAIFIIIFASTALTNLHGHRRGPAEARRVDAGARRLEDRVPARDQRDPAARRHGHGHLLGDRRRRAAALGRSRRRTASTRITSA